MRCAFAPFQGAAMPDQQTPYTSNLFLTAMAADDLELLKPHLVRVDLPREKELVAADEPIDHVYFPEGGVVSITSELRDTATTEIGVFGLEGMSGFHVVLGSDTSPNRTFVQVGDATTTALAIELAPFLVTVEQSPSLQKLCLRYAQVSLTQVTYTAVSNAHHRMEARLARWLLMCHDRIDGNNIELTHRFMSMMITAERSGVTVCLHVLEGIGAIRSTRGLVTVIDRAKLEDIAGDAYGTPEAEYRRLIGPFGKSISRPILPPSSDPPMG